MAGTVGVRLESLRVVRRRVREDCSLDALADVWRDQDEKSWLAYKCCIYIIGTTVAHYKIFINEYIQQGGWAPLGGASCVIPGDPRDAFAGHPCWHQTLIKKEV